MRQILRVLLFPIIWQHEHCEELMMFCLKFIVAVIALVFAATVGYVVISSVFGPFNP